MPREIRGDLIGKGRRFAIVVSRFSKVPRSTRPVGEVLLEGCLERLAKAGVASDAIEVVYVPGAFEIPVVARALARKGACDAVIALGAVIRGETPHFHYVSSEAASGIRQVAVETGVPVIFGVLTCDTPEQALDRLGGKAGHKGVDAAEAALEVVSVLRAIDGMPTR